MKNATTTVCVCCLNGHLKCSLAFTAFYSAAGWRYGSKHPSISPPLFVSIIIYMVKQSSAPVGGRPPSTNGSLLLLRRNKDSVGGGCPWMTEMYSDGEFRGRHCKAWMEQHAGDNRMWSGHVAPATTGLSIHVTRWNWMARGDFKVRHGDLVLIVKKPSILVRWRWCEGKEEEEGKPPQTYSSITM